MTTPDMTPILEDLAAGRIDAAEAARRIDALKGSQTTSEDSPSEPTNEQLSGATADSDPWAAVTDQPQAGYKRENPADHRQQRSVTHLGRAFDDHPGQDEQQGKQP